MAMSESERKAVAAALAAFHKSEAARVELQTARSHARAQAADQAWEDMMKRLTEAVAVLER